MAYRFINLDFDTGVAILTLNRPEVLNSFHRPMAEETLQALQQAAEEASVRAIVLTGAGRAFCAGQDLQAVLPHKGAAAPDLGEIVRTQYNPMIRLIRHTEKPFVAAVNGTACRRCRQWHCVRALVSFLTAAAPLCFPDWWAWPGPLHA